MPETIGIYGLAAGAALAVLGQLWLIVKAFGQSKGWGFGVLLFPPAGLFFILAHFRKALVPLVLFLAAGLIVGGTFAASYYYTHHVDLGPREKEVDGQLHITLTGWDSTDYSVLRLRPSTVVLQMANADVTDQTLDYLKDMSKLRELDLNDTQVTDEGLKTLSELPNLAILRLRGTKVTDDGFRKHLADRDSLVELDLRGTQVSSKTLREWKDRKKDERRFLR